MPVELEEVPISVISRVTASGVDLHNRTSVLPRAHANTRPLRSSNAAATVVRKTAVETSDRQLVNQRRVCSSFTGRTVHGCHYDDRAGRRVVN